MSWDEDVLNMCSADECVSEGRKMLEAIMYVCTGLHMNNQPASITQPRGGGGGGRGYRWRGVAYQWRGI